MCAVKDGALLAYMNGQCDYENLQKQFSSNVRPSGVQSSYSRYPCPRDVMCKLAAILLA